MNTPSKNTVMDPSQLHTEVLGPESAPPLVVLHGWASSAAVMRPLAEALAKSHRVLNVDMPGHGQSPPPPRPIGIPEQAALVDALVDVHLGPSPVSLLGHSNGGRIGLYMASTPAYAARLNRLVLIAPSGTRRPRPWTYYLKRAMAETMKAPLHLLGSGRLRQFAEDHLRYTLPWRLISSSDYQQAEGVMRTTFVKTVNHYLEDQLDQVEIPTLLLWGDEDEAITRQQVDVLRDHLKDVQFVLLEGADHYAWTSHFDRVVDEARDFLTAAQEASTASPPGS